MSFRYENEASRMRAHTHTHTHTNKTHTHPSKRATQFTLRVLHLKKQNKTNSFIRDRSMQNSEDKVHELS